MCARARARACVCVRVRVYVSACLGGGGGGGSVCLCGGVIRSVCVCVCLSSHTRNPLTLWKAFVDGETHTPGHPTPTPTPILPIVQLGHAPTTTQHSKQSTVYRARNKDTTLREGLCSKTQKEGLQSLFMTRQFTLEEDRGEIQLNEQERQP